GHLDYFGNQETPNVLLAKEVLTAQLYATRLHGVGGLDLAWTPVYGKLAAFGSIVHFDLYLLAGFAGVEGEQGILPASEVGLGERIFLTEWMSVGVEGRYDLYVDAASGGPATLQRAFFAGALATVWFPLHPEEH
ncbi:MAG: porin family protein, partial [Deltaproteobacteria bacterium]